ncbi:MAG: hypothetical protein IJX37_00360 [Oscillospiraceae bacterium]|nr:hypothetical protein [Oscillospiraceae bacterium]
MKIPEKLQIPALCQSYDQSDYEQDEDKSSVAAAFFRTEDKHSKQALKTARYKISKGEYRDYNEKEQEDFQTEYENVLRPEIDKALQQAILKTNGVVTAFPIAKIRSTVTLSQTSYKREPEPEYRSPYDEQVNEWKETDYRQQQFALTFDYFRGVEDENHIPYTSYYSNPSAEKLMEKGAELKERMVRVLNRGKERLKKFIANLPTLLVLGLDILLVYSAFANRALYTSLSRAIPYYEFCSQYGGGLSFVHLIGMPIIALIISAFLNIMLDPVIIRGVSKKQAVEDYESFIASSEYLTAKKQLEDEIPRYDRLMKEFYTAWYRHCKKLF